jgi:cytochrome P450
LHIELIIIASRRKPGHLFLNKRVSEEEIPFEGGRPIMVTAINDDLFASDVIADPYTYFGRLREEDPVHWNEKYELWVITRYDDLVWLTRHHELFSSEVFKRDPRYLIRQSMSQTWICTTPS